MCSIQIHHKSQTTNQQSSSSLSDQQQQPQLQTFFRHLQLGSGKNPISIVEDLKPTILTTIPHEFASSAQRDHLKQQHEQNLINYNKQYLCECNITWHYRTLPQQMRQHNQLKLFQWIEFHQFRYCQTNHTK